MRFRTMTILVLVVAVLATACMTRSAPTLTASDETPRSLPTWVSVGPDAAPEHGPKRGPSGAMKALDYWGAQRAYPGRKMPADGYGRALVQARGARGAFEGAGVGPGPAPWAPIGPANIGGRTLCLALHPDDPDVMFAGSASGGLWKTTTGGVGAAAWDRVDIGFPALGVSTIAIDPTDGDVMYVGTGEAYAYQISDGGEVDRTTRGSYGVGILKSVDGGATWVPSLDWTYQQSRGVWMIRIHPTDPDVLYAATTEGVYRSVDAGGSWSKVHGITMAMDVRIHPVNPDIVFAAHGNFGSFGTGIYRSTDGGQNWTKLAGGLPASWSGKAQLALTAGAPVRVFASIADTFSGRGLYRSSDDGDTWTQVSGTDYAQYQGWYSHYVVVSPHNPDNLFTAGIEIWLSTTGGSSLSERSHWQDVFFGTSPPQGPIGGPDYAHADHHFALWHPVFPNTVFFASDGGVFRTTNLGNSFESLIGGYQTTQFYNGFSNSGSDPGFAMGGLQDNFTAIYEGTNAWRRVIGGDGTWSAINPADDQTIYGAAQNLQVFRSYNGGDSWTGISPPTLAGDVTAFVAPYVLCPDQPSVLYAGRSRVYRSDDEGSSWVATNGGFPLSNGDPVISLAVARTTPDVAYAGTAPVAGPARVFRTRNGGNSWVDVSAALPDRYPADIAVDPNDPDRLFVALMGFGTSHVFRSTDGGDSWTDAGAGLPDLPTSAVAIDPDYPQVVYAGTDFGAWVSLDAGDSWQPFDDGLSTAMINDLKLFLPGRKIRAATHGSGAWERDLLGPGTCAAPGEVQGLAVAHAGGVTTLSWSPPVDSGLAPPAYDTLSSGTPSDFAGASADCVESGDGSDTVAQDAGAIGGGEIVYYLVRAGSLCGAGSAGDDSAGTPRAALDCPGT